MSHASGRAAARAAPFDFAACERDAGWRAQVAWPVAYGDSFDAGRAMLVRLLDTLRAIDPPDMRDVATLAAGGIAASSLALVEAALAADAERAHGLRLVGAAPELDFLRGDLLHPPPARGRAAFTPRAAPRGVRLRRIARCASWSPWWRLPRALVRPQALAISHNPLLRAAARSAPRAVGFRHAERLFDELVSAGTGAPPIDVPDALVDDLAGALSAVGGLGAEVRARLQAALAQAAAWWLAQAAGDVARLRRARALPGEIWAGTGGYWPVRALSVEALRRGGRVVRFDHGGGTGFNSLQPVWAVADLSVSSRLVVSSPRIAACAAASGVDALLPADRAPTFVAHHGDPLMRRAAEMRRPAPADKPRVLYAPLPLLGFRQVLPPYLPEPVHLDWQMRLVELLKTLPIHLMCRPHPEGLLRGRVHPLAAITPTSPEPFEALIGQADVFVFDYVQTTTFYEALCTDRPVVLVDMGLPVYDGDARAAIERRCRIVPARFDSGNRPQVDPAALDDAIRSAQPRPEPAEMRDILLADGG